MRRQPLNERRKVLSRILILRKYILTTFSSVTKATKDAQPPDNCMWSKKGEWPKDKIEEVRICHIASQNAGVHRIIACRWTQPREDMIYCRSAPVTIEERNTVFLNVSLFQLKVREWVFAYSRSALWANLTRSRIRVGWRCQNFVLHFERFHEQAANISYFRRRKKIFVHTDGSNYALEAVLMQRNDKMKLVAFQYAGRSLRKSEWIYSKFEKEQQQ